MSKSQIETDNIIKSFLGTTTVESPDDLLLLKNKIWEHIESRPYNSKTKKKLITCSGKGQLLK